MLAAISNGGLYWPSWLKCRKGITLELLYNEAFTCANLLFVDFIRLIGWYYLQLLLPFLIFNSHLIAILFRFSKVDWNNQIVSSASWHNFYIDLQCLEWIASLQVCILQERPPNWLENCTHFRRLKRHIFAANDKECGSSRSRQLHVHRWEWSRPWYQVEHTRSERFVSCSFDRQNVAPSERDVCIYFGYLHLNWMWPLFDTQWSRSRWWSAMSSIATIVFCLFSLFPISLSSQGLPISSIHANINCWSPPLP